VLKPNENAKVILTSTKIPIPTHTAIPPKLYRAQSNSPVYLPNFAHQDLACKWMGVAGQVFDRSGNPAKNIVVVANGKLNGKNLNAVGLTGSSNLYGPGGYEIVLGNSSLTAIGTLTLTVYGLNGVALSDPVPFNTIGNCQKNLILINFIPVR
jgi:hypothetical protein